MKMTLLRIVFLLIVFTYPKESATILSSFFKPLPADIKPDKYQLSIIINTNTWQNFYYKGRVVIQFHCVQQTKRIVLNRYKLTIDTDTVQVFAIENKVERQIRIADQFGTENDEASEYEIILEEDLLKGQYYRTTIQFSKLLQKSVDKQYVFNNWYRNEKMSTGAKLDGLGARDLFPCFDQIHMKAKFEIILHHDSTVQGLSNSMLASTNQFSDSESKKDTFEDTDQIATFSVAIAFLDVAYQYKESFITWKESKISSKLFYINGSLFHLFDNTHKMICNILEYFLNLFDAPLKKFDIVIKPKITTTGYYGFIFMSEIDVLDFLYETNISKKYKLFSKVCLAVSRQWIGNIVTMSHWNETWLLKGLNDFFQVLCVNKFLPDSENRVSQLEIIDSFLEVLEAESEGRHNSILLLHKYDSEYVRFDEKTRNKVYHLIRMMNFFLGSDTFQRGVKKLVESLKFKVSIVMNVWNAFTIIANNEKIKIGETEILPEKFAVDEIMETWTNQNGLPLISVTRNDGSVTVKQKPFPSLYKMKQNEPTKKCWIIPLSFTTKKEQEFENVVVRKWLTCDTSLSVTIPDLTKNDWVLFNSSMNVLGRVNYDEDNWKQIKESLLHGENYSGIDVLTRANLISDMFALAQIGEIPYDMVFDTMKYLSREEHYSVWKVAATAFEKIWLLLRGTKLLELFENYVGTILEPIFKKEEFLYYEYRMNGLASNNEEIKNLLKPLILELSCKFNTDICRKISDEFIKKWKTRPEDEWSEKIPSNINKVIHCQGVKYKNANYRKKLRSHRVETMHSNYNIILEALGCAQSSGSLERYLKYHFRINDKEKSTTVLKTLITNKKGYQIMKKNFKSIFKMFNKDKRYDYTELQKYLYILLDITNVQENLNEVLTFAEDLKRYIGVDFESIHFEKARINVRWLRRYREELKLYLNEGGKNAQSYSGLDFFNKRK